MLHFLPGFVRSDLHKIQYDAKMENDIKNRKLSCSGRIISLPNGENRAKIGKGTAEIIPLALLYEIQIFFRYFSSIVNFEAL